MDQITERILEQFSLLRLYSFPEEISTFVMGNKQQIVEDVAEFHCTYLLSDKHRSVTTTGVATLTAFACAEIENGVTAHASIIFLNFEHSTGALLLRPGKDPVAFYRAHCTTEDTADNVVRVARDIKSNLTVDPDLDEILANSSVATLIISTTSVPMTEIVEKLRQISPIWK